MANNYSNKLQNPREMLERGIDNFSTFAWDSTNAFAEFGAFIINNKNSLKFYNGPSFSNEYSEPQYESAAGNLIGVTFQKQKLSFTMGVYWINQSEYRRMLNWLSPYRIGLLTFGLDERYGYYVKLASIEDSSRYVVGKDRTCTITATINYTISNNKTYSVGETLIDNNEKVWNITDVSTSDGNIQTITISTIYQYARLMPSLDKVKLLTTLSLIDPSFTYGDLESVYYTEMALNFEIQGQPCAISQDEYEFKDWVKAPNGIYSTSLDPNGLSILSDLDTPIILDLPLDIDESSGSNIKFQVDYGTSAYNESSPTMITLFSLSLNNLTFTDAKKPYVLHIEYDSEVGLLYWKVGEETTDKLLSLLSTNTQGLRIVSAFECYKFKMPGKLDSSSFLNSEKLDYSKIKFYLTIDGNRIADNTALISCHARTTMI